MRFMRLSSLFSLAPRAALLLSLGWVAGYGTMSEPEASATAPLAQAGARRVAQRVGEPLPIAQSAASPAAESFGGQGTGVSLVEESTATEAPTIKAQRCVGARCMAPRAELQALLPEGVRRAPPLPRSVRLPRGSNTQLVLPRNVIFADVDGDSDAELLQYTSNKLFVKRADFEQTGLAHLYMPRPIVHVLTGDFNNAGGDSVCPVLDDGSMACYGLNPDKNDLWWWFTQEAIVGANEDAIVGDFDGDARDDVLVYPRTGGAYRLYSIKSDAFFDPTPAFDQGNLAGVAIAGMQLRAGDFSGDGRTDLLAVYGSGHVAYYAAVFDGSRHTFWWAFTSQPIVGGDESIATGRIDDNNMEDIVIRNRTNGTVRFLRPEYNNGYPPALSGVLAGQIATWPNTEIAMLRGAGMRDNVMVYETNGNMCALAGAAAPDTGLTYWWAYDQYLPRNDEGWAPFEAHPWLLVKCKYRGDNNENQTNQWYHDAFADDVPEYFREISYGSWDLSGNRVVDTWYELSDTAQDSINIPGNSARFQRVQRCLRASGQSRDGYRGVVAVVNAAVDSGSQGGDVLMDTWDQAQTTSWFAHEMLHTFGLADSADDSTRRNADWAGEGYYFDSWDIMSANNIFTYIDWRNLRNGPEANALNKRQLNLVPEHRKQILVEDTSKWLTTTVQVAALNRPEANAPLFVEIRKASGAVFTIEYRINDRLDTGIPQTTVMVHKTVAGGPPSVLTTAGEASGWDSERLPGNTYQIDGLGSVRVDSFAPSGYTAQATVTY